MTKNATYLPISSYGAIGDCHTMALISKNGSIDWYCPKRFDREAVFCRLLDSNKGGYLQMAPLEKFSTRRRYLENTNILETTFYSPEFKMRMTDFMPIHSRSISRRGYDVGTSRRIIRLIECVDGEVTIKIEFRPTFDYASGQTTIHIEPGIGIIAEKDTHYMSLSCPNNKIEFKSEKSKGLVSGTLDVERGKPCWFVLTEADDPDRILEMPNVGQCRQQLLRTKLYWEKWSEVCTYNGPYRDKVIRSALTLKLLTYEPTGAIIAAPTTSLPEVIGGIRNWDYRYAWVRDSALILYALINIGYKEEAADFFEWIQEIHHSGTGADLQVLYGIDGRQTIPEKILGHLDGYMKSTPVRIGNAAANQLQLDIYGELITTAYLYFALEIGKRESDNNPKKERLLKNDWPLLRSLVNRAAKEWTKEDNGIWEVRGGLKLFLYSRLMCWAALDRGIRLAKEYSLRAPLKEWEHTKILIRQAILNMGFNKEIGTFTQSFGDTVLDASVLLIPRTGFLKATDSRFRSTLEAVLSRLTRNNLVYRYFTEDGLPGKEGVFLTCSFWLIDALALAGRIDEAHDIFEQISGYANDLGLFSEEIDADNHVLLGNFPQGFTHMAQINAAINLAKTTRHGAESHAETEVDRARKAGPAAAKGYSR